MSTGSERITSDSTVTVPTVVLHGARNSIVVTQPPPENLRNRHQFAYHVRGTRLRPRRSKSSGGLQEDCPMNHRKLSLGICAVALAALAGCASNPTADIHVHAAPDANLSKYSTFGFP